MGCDNGSNNRHKEIQKIKNPENKDSTKINLSTGNINNINSEGMLKPNPIRNSLTENYYLICPDCEIRSPHIEKLYYNEDLKDFMVKYTCICFEDTKKSKEIALIKILSTVEPKNICNIHSENKLKNYCLTCKKAICQVCEDELHKNHNIENVESLVSKEDADKMLKIINEKEEKFDDEINENEKKIENGLDDMIQKLNEEKINYKKQMENKKFR